MDDKLNKQLQIAIINSNIKKLKELVGEGANIEFK